MKLFEFIFRFDVVGTNIFEPHKRSLARWLADLSLDGPLELAFHFFLVPLDATGAHVRACVLLEAREFIVEVSLLLTFFLFFCLPFCRGRKIRHAVAISLFHCIIIISIVIINISRSLLVARPVVRANAAGEVVAVLLARRPPAQPRRRGPGLGQSRGYVRACVRSDSRYLSAGRLVGDDSKENNQQEHPHTQTHTPTHTQHTHHAR